MIETTSKPVHMRALSIQVDGCELPVRLVWSSRPAGRAIVLLHEKRGLDTHTEQLAERLATAGHTVIVPDLLSRLGGSRVSVHGAHARGIPNEWLLDDITTMVDSVAEMLALERLGVLGFSLGGELAWLVAASDPHCRVLVDYHGRPPAPDDGVDLSEVAALTIYSERDDEDKPAVAGRLAGHLRQSHVEVLHGVRRGFDDPTRPDRFDADASSRAWDMTLAWFEEHLA